MARFKQLYRIIEDVVNGISWNIPINSFVDNGNLNYTLDVDCTAYLNECIVFSDGANDWQIKGFTFNNELIVEPYQHSNVWSATEINLGAPTFKHGTVRLTNAEYTSEDRKQDILPMVYLYETLNENVTLVTKNNIERTARIRLFILMSNKFNDFIQVDYDQQIYDPLSNIEEQLIKGLIDNSKIGKFTSDYERINHDQFGYTDRDGELKRIFADELSALELEIPLNINRCGCNDADKCKCN